MSDPQPTNVDEPMVGVIVGNDEDYDSPWIHRGDADDAEDRYDAFHGKVPERLVNELEAAWAEGARLGNVIAGLVGTTPEGDRLLTPCAAWRGDELSGREWYEIVLAASGSEHEWPVIDSVMAHHDTMAEAEAALAELPDEFWMSNHHQMVRIRKDRLTIEHKGYPGSSTSCYGCGWSKGTHAGPPTLD